MEQLCFLRRNQTKPSSFHIKIRRLSVCLLSLIFSSTILNFSYLTYTVYKKPFRLLFSEDLCQVSRWRLAAAPPLAEPGPWYWATRRPASCPLTASSPRYLSRVVWLWCVTCNMSRVTQEHSVQLVDNLRRIYDEEDCFLHDVTLVSSDKGEVRAHKIILAAQSDYFKVSCCP